ncbi:phosphoribosylglycinamide formyltransferase [Heterostelium album PN500]|uniref:phosphoribosylglycinamide formyltransferase 1 n=1 Tax=Heterostelium pallidum (strain ATCC 26659 / Pp 5 / PN500) TaxID=670386 RepID=D3BK14_HETP5|nr:phosphoribosylglycinamide formyltransferase [Heterostelium album PN500]EFA78244.1 phosphoribosylglycinamide formyltransferase [Heterostelium album PN500]|eukprot:XP_020430369.1 phosphoribosylglycinamide formyltransferase [Heterostelium album PN500]
MSSSEINKEFNLVVLISGNGTNLQAIIDAIENGNLPNVKISAVISNKSDAFGLKRAEKASIETKVFPLQSYLKGGEGRDRSTYGTELAKLIRTYQPKLIVLAGFMLILTPSFLNEFENNQPHVDVINLHPALPGQFAGAHAIQRAFEAYQNGQIKHTGLMVHKVIEEIDAGEVIMTAEVPINAEDTLDILEDRMHKTEHITLVSAIKKLSQSHL